MFGYDGLGGLFLTSSDIVARTCGSAAPIALWVRVSKNAFLVDVTSPPTVFLFIPPFSLQLDLLIRRCHICGSAARGCRAGDFDECASAAVIIGGRGRPRRL